MAASIRIFILAMLVSSPAHAQTTPASTAPPIVITPITASSAQSNQTLLNQINQTLVQRSLQHQILTQPSPILFAQPTLIFTPRAIQRTR